MWDATTGRELLTLTGHGPEGISVAFSGDGLRIITGSIALPAQVWEAATPMQVAAWEEEELNARPRQAIGESGR